MTSDKFVRKVATDNNLTLKEVRAMVDYFETAVKAYVASGESVKVLDVNFDVADVPETTRYNPIEKKPITYPATKRVTTRPSAELKRTAKGM